MLPLPTTTGTQGCHLRILARTGQTGYFLTIFQSQYPTVSKRLNLPLRPVTFPPLAPLRNFFPFSHLLGR